MLAALPPEDYARLLPALEPLCLPKGWTVHGAGRVQRYLYFLTQGVVSRSCTTQAGKTAETAITGNEGVIGVTLCLGGGSTSSQAVVVVRGFAYRLEGNLLMTELGRHGPLMELLLRYTQAVMTETGQNGACNRHHALPNQLCRWILALLDRVPSGTLQVTHEEIAELLGVRREGVTLEAGKLQTAGLIEYRRGRMKVMNRPGLEARACECYAVIKQEYDRLFPDQGAQPAGRRGPQRPWATGRSV